MDINKVDIDDANFSLDLSDATQAVKESRFEEALKLLSLILRENPTNIDTLYLAAVSTRYLKKFDQAKKHLENLLLNAPDMGRAFQELGHLSRDMGDEEKAVMHYRQACELNPALIASWNFLYKYFEKKK